MTPFAQNLIAWFAQASLVAAAGVLLPSVVKLRHAGARLIYWQTVLVLCLALPFLQPRLPAGWTGGGAEATVTRSAGTTAPPRQQGVPYEPIALAAIAVGIVFRLAKLGAGMARLNRWRAASRPYSHPLPERLGVPAEIAVSDDVLGPVTFGWRRPVVLVPPDFPELPEWRQESALCHELVHVRRRDWAVAMAEEIAGAMVWFHPAIWWLRGQIQLAREQAVDREAVRLTGARQEYLDALLESATERSGLDLAPATLFLRKQHLARRVGALTKETGMSKAKLSLSLALGFFAVLGAGLVSIGLFPLRSLAQGEFNVTVYRNQAAYPAAARSQGHEGQVIVEREIGPGGETAGARVMSGPVEFREAALELARQSRLAPERSPFPRSSLTAFNFVNQDEPAAEPKRIRVGGNRQATKVIYKVNPTYPPEAKEARIQGKVELQVVVSREGSVTEVNIKSGETVLANAAAEAVRQWRFSTTLLNGNPVEVVTQVDVNFTLKE